ncbi:MAG: transcription antitermination factor NusB [Acidobacteria bacterium SCN 69-37]|nr:MAG: transcription antitermination factor NusB [Acidobacteria bacterium SCN 69-37]
MTGRRTHAREAALQILYFWEVGRAQPLSAIEAFFAEHQPEADEATVDFVSRLVLGTIADVAELDRVIERHARRWRVERLAVVDRMILRLATWELRHETETPGPVVINEALELARRFSSDDAVRFVNGVLDAVYRDRPAAAAPGADPVD